MSSSVEERRSVKTDRSGQGLYPPPFLGPSLPAPPDNGYQVSKVIRVFIKSEKKVMSEFVIM